LTRSSTTPNNPVPKWIDYKNGFVGNPMSFIGLDALHLLTCPDGMRLKAEYESGAFGLTTAEYGTFKVGDELSTYQVTIGGYIGLPFYNGLYVINGLKFAAPGQPADAAIADAQQCATDYQVGWWFGNCGFACGTCTTPLADKTSGTNVDPLISFQACLAPKIG
jgi:hypothetical protein